MQDIVILDTVIEAFDAAESKSFDSYELSVIKWMPIDSIFETEGISSWKVDELVSDIIEKNLFRPIIIDEDYYVIDEHHRFAAAEKMGWTRIPVIVMKEKQQ